MKVYFFTAERPESSFWTTLTSLPADGETVMVDGFRFKVAHRLWEVHSTEPETAEVTIYLEKF